ncbi:MAG TPA: SRPBCC domain-containing protein [Caulobacteraceae bacterium]|nr:SRPBCC domain-containing protein [Caulobacteraceae bacterium]
MSDDGRTLVVEADLDAPPDRVWRALSDPTLSSQWLPSGKVGTRPGERFTLDDEGRRIDCEVLDAEPGRRLRLSWREADSAVSSQVTFVVSPGAAGGARLRIVHEPVVASLAVQRTPAGVRAFPTRMAA